MRCFQTVRAENSMHLASRIYQVLATPTESLCFKKFILRLSVSASCFQPHKQRMGEATVAYIGEHCVLVQIPLINQTGNSRTSSAAGRGGTKLAGTLSMAAEAKNAHMGMEVGSLVPSPLVPSMTGMRLILLTRQPSRGIKAC